MSYFRFCLNRLLLPALLGWSLPAASVIELVILGEPGRSVEQQLVSSITAEEIEARGYASLDQLLQAQPGLDTRSTGGAGSYSQVGIRGSSARQVAVYLDGVLVNAASGAPVDLSRFDLANVERIDIYRDLQPLAFDQPAVGGIIHVITRRDRRDGRLSLALGSFGERRASIGLGGRNGLWRYRLHGEAAAADNDYELLNDNGTDLNPHDDRTEPRRNAQTRSEGLQWFLRRDRLLDAPRFLTLDLQLRQSRQHVPNRRNDPLNRAFLDRRSELLTLSLADEPGRRYWSHRLSLRNERSHYLDLTDQVGLDAQDNDYDDRRMAWQSRFNSDGGDGWRFGLSLDLSREDYRSVQRLGSLGFRPNEEEYRRERGSLGLRASRRWLDGRLELTPQVRWSTQRDRALEDGDDSREQETMAQLGWSWRLDERHAISGFIGRFGRSPSFSERFADQGFTVGNPQLRKEVTDALSLSWLRRSGGVVDEAALTGYLRRNHDLIVISYDARGIGHYENIGDSTVAGIELSLRGAGPGGLDWSLAYSLNASRIDSDISAYDGGRLPNTPLQTLQLDLGGCLGSDCRWRYWYRNSQARDAWYDSANLLPVADRHLQDIGIDYRRDRWTLGLAINNLGDQSREEFNGFPGPGRSWKATFNLQL